MELTQILIGRHKQDIHRPGTQRDQQQTDFCDSTELNDRLE